MRSSCISRAWEKTLPSYSTLEPSCPRLAEGSLECVGGLAASSVKRRSHVDGNAPASSCAVCGTQVLASGIVPYLEALADAQLEPPPAGALVDGVAWWDCPHLR